KVNIRGISRSMKQQIILRIKQFVISNQPWPINLRLSNFDITPCFTDNRQIDVYYAVGKENTSECRFFIRSLVRPGRLRNSMRAADYLISESDRLLNEILDFMEIVNSEHKNADCNHLFINFIPTFVLEPKQDRKLLKDLLISTAKLMEIACDRSRSSFQTTLGTSYPLTSGFLNQPTHLNQQKNGFNQGFNNNLQEVERASGTNSFGMVAWIFTLFTQNFPKTANSGARIGLAEEVMNHFNVAWIDKENPSKGRRYTTKSPTLLDQKMGFVLREVSGLFAGITSRAYEDIFTIMLVTCRSVYIGAYLVRLGQCIIKNEGQHVILTGSPALNKELGREVYTGNLQLGGTQIMLKNRVSHLTAQNDYKGYAMSFLRSSRNSIFMNSDTLDRDVNYVPPRALRSKMYYKYVYIVPMENFVVMLGL
ncbi:14818_t:CDS:2, partial [Funneliformis geosporum]